MTSLLKKLTLMNPVAWNLDLFSGEISVDISLESLTLTSDSKVGYYMLQPLFNFLSFSKIRVISFEGGLFDERIVSHLVNRREGWQFWPESLEILDLCGVTFINYKIEGVDEEMITSIGRLIASLPTVTIGQCQQLCYGEEDLEKLKKVIKLHDKENGERKASLIGLDSEWITSQIHPDYDCPVCNI